MVCYVALFCSPDWDPAQLIGFSNQDMCVSRKAGRTPVVLSLSLNCLLLRLSIEVFWACVRVGSCSMFFVSAVSLMLAICGPSESGASSKAVPAPSLRSMGESVACEAYFSEICSSLRAIDSEVAMFVNSMKPMIAELVSKICPSGSWVVSGPGS